MNARFRPVYSARYAVMIVRILGCGFYMKQIQYETGGIPGVLAKVEKGIVGLGGDAVRCGGIGARIDLSFPHAPKRFCKR